MKIHASDGLIEFAHGSVSRETDRASFLASKLGRPAETIVENGPYQTFRVNPEPGIGATLLFKDEQLENVAWAFRMPDEVENSWTEETEMQRKALHDAWLVKYLGEPPYRYAWGRIDSEYDSKAVSSAIILVYDR